MAEQVEPVESLRGHRPNNGHRWTNEEIIKGLDEAQGMVYIAAEAMGCAYNTIIARIARSPEVADHVRQNKGKMLDTTELKLYQAIMRGDPWAIQFYLKTQGKERGYVDRTEIKSDVEITVRQAAEALGLDPEEAVTNYRNIVPIRPGAGQVRGRRAS